MAGIDDIIAGVGGGTRADFSGLFSGPVDAYNAGRDTKAKNDLRDAFKGGVPTTADGQPDFSAMAKTLFQKGGLTEGTAAAQLGIAQQNQKFGQEQSGGIQRFESGQSPQQIVSPPSANRTATAVVAPPLNKGGEQKQGSPQGDQPGSIVGLVSAAGVPDELAGPIIQQVSAATRMDPNAAVHPQMAPRVQQIVAEAVRRTQQAGQPQPQMQQAPVPQAPPAIPQGQPAPVTNAVTTTQAPATPSRIDQGIAFYAGILSDPRSPANNVKLAQDRLKALQDNSALTPDQKNYSQAVLQGFKGTMQDFLTEQESSKTAATEEAKLGAKRYEQIVENGTKAQMEIPQLDLLKEQMNDPNFFSGAGEKYNLLYKRLKSAVGIDPEAAVPQEYLRKATAANVLSSLGALKGLGQIRVAEINMAREAAASPDNSIPANKLLVEISKRTHQRNADIAEMAQSYKEQNGKLDPVFDKQVTAYYKKNPLFTDAEIKDWHKVIGEAKPGGNSLKFSSPADVHAAVAAGTLKKGDSFVDGNGKTRYVP